MYTSTGCKAKLEWRARLQNFSGSVCENGSGFCVLPQTFIKELVAKLVGVHKQEDLQSEGIEHPVICHSLHRHEPYQFNNPQHHFHQTRGHNQSLWWGPDPCVDKLTHKVGCVGLKNSGINRATNILTHFKCKALLLRVKGSDSIHKRFSVKAWRNAKRNLHSARVRRQTKSNLLPVNVLPAAKPVDLVSWVR